MDVRRLEPIIPSFIWEGVKRFYSRMQYAILWRKRSVVSFSHDGIPVKLLIVNPVDLIQSEQARGSFYEIDDLILVAPYFPKGGTFVDVGANTGQHSIFFAKVLGAAKLVLFEPMAPACKILLENLRLNGLESITDVSHLGIGLSNRSGKAGFTIHTSNIGSAALNDGNGPIPVATGDDLLGDQPVHFIKIDTEGFEIKVLRGLQRTINRNRPTMYVEVDDGNREEFLKLIEQIRYHVILQRRRYTANENFLIASDSP